MNQRLSVILFGPPGSGKGTQAAILKQNLGLPHISTGDILRERIASGDPLGREVAEIMNTGELVSDAIVNRIVDERVEQPDAAKGFILDGYPRTVAQAELLNAMLRVKGVRSVVVHLLVEYNEVIARLAWRRQCALCGELQRVESNGSRKCVKCGGANLVVRDDDRPDVVEQRLKAYDQKTAPVLSYLRGVGYPVFEVKAESRTPEAIAAEIATLIAPKNGLGSGERQYGAA